MVFTDKDLESLKSNPVQKAVELCDYGFSRLAQGSAWSPNDYQILKEMYQFFRGALDSGVLPIQDMGTPELDGSGSQEECGLISTWLLQLRQECAAQSST